MVELLAGRAHSALEHAEVDHPAVIGEGAVDPASRDVVVPMQRLEVVTKGRHVCRREAQPHAVHAHGAADVCVGSRHRVPPFL